MPLIYQDGIAWHAVGENVSYCQRWQTVSLWRDGLCHARVSLPARWLSDRYSGTVMTGGHTYSKQPPRPATHDCPSCGNAMLSSRTHCPECSDAAPISAIEEGATASRGSPWPDAPSHVVTGALLTLADGSRWFHPYGGGAPFKL
jgi:hypothetical protein